MSELDDFRARISATDRVILDALNERLRLVAELKDYKEQNGISFVDAGREEQLIADLVRENGGPISEEGLRTFFVTLLAQIKRELES